MKDNSFLGTGWSFPPTFHKHGVGGVEMVANEKDIKQSLEILLGTKLGERLMVPLYGCDLYSYLFDSISTSRTHLITEMIRTAIIRYEPRVNLLEVTLDESEYLEGIVRVRLDYTIRLTNTRFNLVFPYYKVEGTDIPSQYKKQAQHPRTLPQTIVDKTD